MKYTTSCFLSLLFTLAITLPSLHAQSMDRIEVAGKDLFMNGGNVAWVNFARDIGPGHTNLTQFENIFQEVQEHGGNTMRLWLHTNGTSTPEWDGDLVSGPGQNTIDDLHDILDLAQNYNVSLMLCLWSFDMMQGVGTQTGLNQDQIDKNRALLTQDEALQSYIDNALIPMVEALEGHAAINSWEIFNEPEGMTEYGWAPNKVAMSDIQWFVNRTAGAIKRAAPEVKVTNGSWNIRVLSDIESFHNYYTDDRLIAAGGDPDGTLDFYTVHFYPEHFPASQSPFHNDADHWELDKPLVVAEFWPIPTHGVATDDLYTTLYDRGYAGAMAWSWSDTQEPWQPALDNMKTIFDHYPEDVILDISEQINARFQIFPTEILQGDEVELTWYSSGAESVTINGEDVSLRGSRVDTPTDTTVYTLIATDGEEIVELTDTVFVVPPEAFNRAFQKPAVASSIEDQSHLAAYATDGRADTRWSSVYIDEEWIYVNLKRSFEINRIVLNWETAYGQVYDLQVSNDAVNWQTIHEEQDGRGGVDEIILEEPVLGRYVRMYGHERGTEWGFSLWEFEVYGLDSELQPPRISVTSPLEGQLFDTGDEVLMKADMDQGTKEPQYVRFLVNGEPVEQIPEEPYESTWIAPEPGAYDISAVVSDPRFDIQAKPVRISVQEPPETVRYDVSVAGQTDGAEIMEDETAFDGTFTRTGSHGIITWDNIAVNVSDNYDIRISYRLESVDNAPFILRIPPFVNREMVLSNTAGEWSHHDILDLRLTSGENTVRLDADGTSVDVDHIAVRGEGQIATSGHADADIPMQFDLLQNYPNPFNPTTVLQFDLPVDEHVHLAIYDLLGRQIEVLADQRFPAGSHQLLFDASRLSSGLYIYRIDAGSFTQSRRMTFLK